jgi:hypothetical protein
MRNNNHTTELKMYTRYPVPGDIKPRIMPPQPAMTADIAGV